MVDVALFKTPLGLVDPVTPEIEPTPGTVSGTRVVVVVEVEVEVEVEGATVGVVAALVPKIFVACESSPDTSSALCAAERI